MSFLRNVCVKWLKKKHTFRICYFHNKKRGTELVYKCNTWGQYKKRVKQIWIPEPLSQEGNV